jgi:hypothetical protein
MKKVVIFFIFLLLVICEVFLEDYKPLYEYETFTMCSETQNAFFKKYGVLLSRTDNFEFYYMNGLGKFLENYEKDQFPADAIFGALYILYDNHGYYLNIHSLDEYMFSIVGINPPTILFNYLNKQFDVSHAIICMENNVPVMSVYKVSPIHGDSIIDNIVFPSYFRYTFYIDNVKYEGYKEAWLYKDHGEYFFIHTNFGYNQYFKTSEKLSYYTYINDDSVRLRTSCSRNSRILDTIDKNTFVRILLINPKQEIIDDKYGCWVLIQTETHLTGWIWSRYIEGLVIPR